MIGNLGLALEIGIITEIGDLVPDHFHGTEETTEADLIESIKTTTTKDKNHLRDIRELIRRAHRPFHQSGNKSGRS